MPRSHRSLAIPAALSMLTLSIPTAAQTTLTILAGNQNPQVIGAAVREFEEDHPDIKVELILEAWNTVDDKFTVLVASGMAPDVFINNSVYGWAKYAYQGLFTDLTPYVNRDAAGLRWNQFFEPAIQQSKIGGRLYGMPAGPSTGFATTYNATLLEDAGLQAPPTDWNDPSWDWDTMVAYARKLTKVENGRATRYGVDFWDADGPLLAMAYAFGGDWFDAASYQTGIVQAVRLNTPENVRAYEAVASLRTQDQVRPGGPLGGPGGGIQNFGSGQIAMWLEIVQFRPATFAPATQFKWGFAPFPYPRGSERRRIASWGGGGFAAIPVGAKHPEAAWTFLKWVATTDRADHPGLRDWMAVGGPRSSWFAAVDQWYQLGLASQSRNQVLQVMMGAVERAVGLPRQVIAGGTEVWNIVNKELTPTLRGSGPVSAALARAQTQAEAAVREFKQKITPGR